MQENFEKIGIVPKGKYSQQKVKCPKCSHTRKNKRDTSLSINLDDGLYHCHHCGWNGSVNPNNMKQEKTYTKPTTNNLKKINSKLSLISPTYCSRLFSEPLNSPID